MVADQPGLTIVICDERRAAREHLGAFLAAQPGVAAVDLVGKGDEAVRALRRGADVLLLDVRHVGGASAAEVLEALANLGSTTPVLLLGIPDDVSDIVRAVVERPIGIVRSDVRLPTLLDVIDQVVRGSLVLSESVVAPVITKVSEERRQREESTRILASLTMRERTVLQMLSSGLRRADIADRLGLSPNTVRTHLAHVMQKLHAHTQVAAAMKGRELFAHAAPSVVSLPDAQVVRASAGQR